MTAISGIRAGDVLKATHARWPEGTYVQGPAYVFGNDLRLAGYAVNFMDRPYWTVEVISRAPRPFYVNSDRDPVEGDIVNYQSGTGIIGPFMHAGSEAWAGARPGGRMTPWRGFPGGHADTGPLYNAGRVVLLVDGLTGKAVP